MMLEKKDLKGTWSIQIIGWNPKVQSIISEGTNSAHYLKTVAVKNRRLGRLKRP